MLPYRRPLGGCAFALVAGWSALLAACSAPNDERVGTSRSAAGTAFPNDKTAYDYFAGKGLTNYQAAGIVGNLDQESGVDPTAVESGGPGRGIAQWSVGGRWDTGSGDNLLAYATQQGESSSSLGLQLDFIWYELQTFPEYGLAQLQASGNVTDATVAFETDFEECASCDESTRISYAMDVLAAYGNDPVVTDAGAAKDAGGGGGEDAATTTPDAGTDAGALAVVEGGAFGDAVDSGVGEQDSGATNGAGAPVAADASSSGCSVGFGREPNEGGGRWMAALALVVACLRSKRRAEPS